MSVTVIREETVKSTRVIGTNGAGEDSKSGKYPGTNFIQVLCIWYSIIFQKKFVLIFFNLNSEVNAIYLTFA